MRNYSYLQPPVSAQFINPLDHTFISSTNGNKQRKIFNSDTQEYTPDEIESINRLKEYLKTKNPGKNYPDSLLLKYCHLGSFLTSQSKETFKYYEDWWGMADISREKEKEILHSGVFYCYGRDHQFCPVLYMRPHYLDLQRFEIQDYLVALRTLLSPVEEHMLIPGRVERWNLVIDLRNFKPEKQTISYQFLHENAIKIFYAYPFRLRRIFLVEKKESAWPGFSAKKINAVHKLIESLKLSDKCVRISHFSDFNKYIPEAQREKQFGGTLEDLCEFWPIQTTNRLTEQNSRIIDQVDESDSCYYSIASENRDLILEGEESISLCDLKSHCLII